MSILRIKSFSFAVRVVKLSEHLQTAKKDFVISKQILRSGTAIGALVYEADFGQSKSDFIHKLSIALKEAHETRYWIALMKETKFISLKMFQSLDDDCKELVAILVSSIKTAKSRK